MLATSFGDICRAFPTSTSSISKSEPSGTDAPIARSGTRSWRAISVTSGSQFVEASGSPPQNSSVDHGIMSHTDPKIAGDLSDSLPPLAGPAPVSIVDAASAPGQSSASTDRKNIGGSRDGSTKLSSETWLRQPFSAGRIGCRVRGRPSIETRILHRLMLN